MYTLYLPLQVRLFFTDSQSQIALIQDIDSLTKYFPCKSEQLHTSEVSFIFASYKINLTPPHLNISRTLFAFQFELFALFFYLLEMLCV